MPEIPPRLSLNQITTRSWSLPQAVDGCAAAGLAHIGLWRDKVAEVGVAESARLCREAGLRVSSLCRGGFFPAADEGERAERRDDNRRAVNEAAALGTDTLIVVCGGLPDDDRDLDRARQMVLDGISELVPYAANRGVRLAIEPLHPMFSADRSVVVTLAQANDIAQAFPADQVGVVVDTFHLWWDPGVWREIARAGERIYSFQVCDWLVPLPDILLGRGMMGDGVIELRRFREAVDAAGYRGPIEVEIFNQEIWGQPPEVTLAQMIERYRTHVA